jgi:O-antigen/teichoic acid export membrane protein
MNLDVNSTKQEYLSDLSKITKGAGINLGGMIVGKGLLFFYTIFLAKVLGANDLGLYFLGITIVGFLAISSNLGLNISVTRFVAIYSSRNDLKRLKGTVLIATAITLSPSLIIMCLTFLLGDLVAISIFHKPELGKVIKLLSLSIPFDSLIWIFLAATRGLKLMQYTAYTENLCWVGLRFLFAVLFLLVFGMKLEGAVLAYVLSSFFSAALAFYYANKVIPLTDGKVIPVFEVKNLLKFSLPMVFSIFLGNLTRQIDVLMLGLFVSAAEVGIYSVVVRIIVLAEIVFGIFMPIFNPFVSDLYERKEFSKLSNLLEVITRWNVSISFPVFLSLLFFPGFFLHFFGAQFVQASICLSILVIAHLFSSISGLPSSIIFMSGRSDITFKNNSAMLLLNVLLNYLLIPQYGIMGAAIATGISLVLIAFVRITEVYYLMKINPFKKYLWKPVTAGIISVAFILSLRKCFLIEGDALLITLLFTFFFMYYSLVYLFKLNEEDIYLTSIIKKKAESLLR